MPQAPRNLRRNQAKTNSSGLKRAANKARETPPLAKVKSYDYPIVAPKLMARVVPDGVKAPVSVAMDASMTDYLSQSFPGGGFPGYPYLSQLATRPEYRAFASTLSTELTRKWIEFTSKQDDDDDTGDKIKLIEKEFERLDVRGCIQKAAEHDCYFGRAQIFIKQRGADRATPLVLSKRTVSKGSLESITPVEAIWTTPAGYNALDPAAPDFYKPSRWWMLGDEVHASRLLTIVTRPLPDMLKPAFNFSGMSMSQLAEPYVDNWLRTRQSVADLINNFSITVLATSMDQVLQGDDDGTDLFARADLFTATRSNRGMMLLDKDREELVQVNTPLSGLHELQAQSQEHMCSVSRTPAIVLTGISPSGLNASSEGEIRVFNDWIAAQQTAYWRSPIETILAAAQLSLFGEIDPDIGFMFVPLEQMSPKEESEIRTADGATDCAYIAAGVLDPSEVRDKLAKDPVSGYQGLDTDAVVAPPGGDPEDEPPPEGLEGEPKDKPAQDAEPKFEEGKHPRDASGKFGSGGAGGGGSSAGKSEGSAESNAHYPKLSESEQKIESDFYAAVDTHGPELVSSYQQKFGNVIDPDLVKRLSPDFDADPTLAHAVHEPSSKLAKMIFKDALERKAAAGDTSPTVFTAGGSGSGKSTTMPGALAQLGAKPDGLIYDSVLSSKSSAVSRIDQALAATKGDVGIAYTNADVAKASMLNALRERSVAIDTLIHAHLGASDTLRELAKHYKDDPRVKITVMNNRGGLDDIAVGSVEDVPKYQKFELRNQLVGQAKELLDEGAITKAKYDLLIR
jgi:phage-related protein (TIGR01555 family)